MPATEASADSGENAGEQVKAVPVKFRYAFKTSLSLTLAYLIPMAMGWPQPQTAATTVMLIAATGMLSESLQKGVLRVLGTVVGAVVGLTLIITFPQDRMLYLLAVSLVVSLILYLYNAYQGDSTVFMLAAVVTLMVFNGGDAEGAFLYGVDRAFMTVFGVLVYTVVASLLWPVKTADNTRELAATVGAGYARAFARLAHPEREAGQAVDEQLAELLGGEEAFQTQFAAVSNSADGVTDYLPEWRTIVACYEELESQLVPALKQEAGAVPDFSRHIANYDTVVAHIEGLFQRQAAHWQGQQQPGAAEAIPIELLAGSLDRQQHLAIAAVATRAEILQRVQAVLLEMDAALNSLLFDRSGFRATREPRGKPAFLWLDLENAKTAVRAFVIFWIASGIWIAFNPPGGFMFVTMCTVLILLVSYTPVTPKLLIILFTLGFMFALPAYVFLLPNMVHWTQLAAFLFAYAFIGFYVFQGPVSIFFLLGLFTLGIQNSMNYNVDVILMIMLMFYMVCAMQIISTHFPFTSKPQKLYASLRGRFFRNCARQLRLAVAPPGPRSWLRRLLLGSSAALLAKMQHWGAMIDSKYGAGSEPQQITRFNRACELLQGQLQILARRRGEFSDNPLIKASQPANHRSTLADLCDNLAEQGPEQPFTSVQASMSSIGERLNELLGDKPMENYEPRQLAQFYVYLNLQASIISSITACRDAQAALDLQQLGESKF